MTKKKTKKGEKKNQQPNQKQRDPRRSLPPKAFEYEKPVLQLPDVPDVKRTRV